MIKGKKNLLLWLFFFAQFLWSELVLRAFASENFFGIGLLYIFLYSVVCSAVVFSFLGIFRGKKRRIIGGIVTVLTMLVYESQVVYFYIFHTYYTFFSAAANGGKFLQFFYALIDAIFKSGLYFLALMIPPAIFFVFIKKLTSKNIRLALCWLAVATAVVFHMAAYGCLFITGNEPLSPYDLYFNTSEIAMSFDRLGLAASMRLDLKRLITGFSEKTDENMDMSSIEIVTGDTLSEEVPEKINEEAPVESSEPLGDNVLEIDFDKLIEDGNSTVSELSEYFKTIEPTSKNEMTGLFEGKNLIFIVAESFSQYVIDKDLTPTLYKMQTEGMTFTNFYNPIWGVSTSDGEYVALTGLIPKSGVWSLYRSSKNELPFVLGNSLAELGYTCNAYHNNDYTYYNRNISHPNLGYNFIGCGNGLTMKNTWPRSDYDMVDITTDLFINDEPFHTYYLTVSGHLNYTFEGNAMATKNRALVADLPYSSAVKAYLSANIELDRAMELLLERLEESGKLDDTVIVITADHYPYGLKASEISELAGHDVETNFELYRNTLIVYNSATEPRTVTKSCSTLDILPTVLNLFGIEYDSRLLMGTDIFSDTDPLVLFVNRSWITGDAMYNSKTKTMTITSGLILDKDYALSISETVSKKFSVSAQILDSDYYRAVMESMEQD